MKKQTNKKSAKKRKQADRQIESQKRENKMYQKNIFKIKRRPLWQNNLINVLFFIKGPVKNHCFIVHRAKM